STFWLTRLLNAVATPSGESTLQSTTTRLIGLPAIPPASLISSMAICVPFCICSPSAAYGPVVGYGHPIRYGLPDADEPLAADASSVSSPPLLPIRAPATPPTTSPPAPAAPAPAMNWRREMLSS